MKYFTKSRFVVVLAAAALLVSTAVAKSGKQDFVLHNATGVEIHSLFVSPHSANDWEEDILGKATLPTGESVKVSFEDRDQRVKWDLRVTDKNGNALEWYDLNLAEIEDVTLHWDAQKKKGWADIK